MTGKALCYLALRALKRKEVEHGRGSKAKGFDDPV